MTTSIEHNIGRSLVATLKAASITATVQEQGYRQPASGVEEWLTFDLVNIQRRRTRRGVYIGAVFFQIGCFSVLAKDRADGQMTAPWKLAGLVQDAFEQKILPVLDYTTGGTPEIAKIQVGEGDTEYTREREQLGAGGGLSVPGETGVHYVVVTFVGIVTRRT